MFLNVIDWSIFENFDWKIFQFAENIKCGFLDYFLGAISWLGNVIFQENKKNRYYSSFVSHNSFNCCKPLAQTTV